MGHQQFLTGGLWAMGASVVFLFNGTRGQPELIQFAGTAEEMYLAGECFLNGRSIKGGAVGACGQLQRTKWTCRP